MYRELDIGWIVGRLIYNAARLSIWCVHYQDRTYQPVKDKLSNWIRYFYEVPQWHVRIYINVTNYHLQKIDPYGQSKP